MRGNSKILLVSLVLVSIASVGCGRRAARTNAKAAPLTAAAVAGVAEIQNRSREWSAMATNHPVWERSAVRTGADSFVTLNSQVSADRIVLGEESEVGVDEWELTGPGTSAERVQLHVRRGVVVVDVPISSGASMFEVKGSNFVAGVRSSKAVVAITADGSVLVRSGMVVCAFVSPNLKNLKAVTLNAGEMVHPRSLTVKAIPAESNAVWNLLGP